MEVAVVVDQTEIVPGVQVCLVVRAALVLLQVVP